MSKILDKISFWSLFVVIVLLPVFFLPFTKIPIETGKGLLLVGGLAISILCWTAARFSDGKISIPRSPVLLAGLGVAFAFLLSAFFSQATQASFFGTMFDTGTFWFMCAAVILMIFSSIILHESARARITCIGLMIASGALLLFQTLHVFMPQFLSFGFLESKTDTIIGSFTALGIFAGFSMMLSLFLLEFYSLSNIKKFSLYIVLLLSLFIALLVNTPVMWGLTGIFALIIFVYKINSTHAAGHVKPAFPALPFFTVMICLLFFMAGNFIGNYMPTRLGVSNLEVRPSFASTLVIAKNELTQHPMFGTGPGRFTTAWSLYKPADLNTTRFWDSTFESGSGTLPTFAVTTGAVGIVSLIVFFCIFLWSGVRSLFAKRDAGSQVHAFFLGSLFLFCAAFFYVPGPAILLLAFALAGVFAGLSSRKSLQFNFLDDPRKSFFSILLLVLVMVASAAGAFKYVERFASVVHFQKAISAPTIAEAEASTTKALNLYDNDLYYRTYAQIEMIKVSSVASKFNTPNADTSELQISFDRAVAAAEAAIAYDDGNFLNHRALGSIYDAVISLGVQGALEKAVESYQVAADLSPLHPGPKLAIARAYLVAGKLTEAGTHAAAALTLKPDYTDALITLSQIAKAESNTADAIAYAEAALRTAPESEDLQNYIRSLKSSDAPKAAPADDKEKETDDTDN